MMLLGSMMIKNSLAYIWGFEISHSSHKKISSSIINMFDFANAAVAGGFFLFVSNDWFELYLPWVGMSVCAYLVILLFCPESPKWLLMQGRTEEAIESLNYIAWFNGSGHRVPTGTEFVEGQLCIGQEDQGTPVRHRTLKVELSFKDVSDHAEGIEIHEDKRTLMVEFLIISIFYAMCYMQYGLAYLTLAGRGGNMFVNGILLSVAEAASTGVTGWALGVMKDVTVFRVCALMNIIFNLTYFMLKGYEDLVWLRYSTLFLSYLGQAGCFNCVFVVMEMRFPPQQMASAIAMSMQVIAPLLCSLNPIIASSEAPIPLFWIVSLGCCQYFWSYALPPPGKYLPTTEEIEDDDNISRSSLDGKLLPYEARNSTIDDPLHHEKVHGVVRPTRIVNKAATHEL